MSGAFQTLIPPHDPDAERALLGSALLDPLALTIALSLRSEDFFEEKHRVIHSAMRSLAERGAPVDSITLRAELGRRARLDDLSRPATPPPDDHARGSR